MNQKAVIYIILSAILLYLYYRKGDLAIFAAFAVVVTGTLILGKGGVEEGFGMGGGGCAKIGFKEVKIDKKNINGSLKKIFANFKTVTSKYLDYNDKSAEPKEEYIESIRALEKFEIIKSEMEKINKVPENGDYIMAIAFGSMSLLQTYLILPEEESRTQYMETLKKFKEKNSKGKIQFEQILKGGELGSKVLEKIKKSDELKESDKEVKKVFSVIECTFKQVLAIWKALDKAVVKGDGGDEGEGDGDGGDGGGGDGGGDGDDDEDKKKKKKKKATKKKKKAADDDGDGGGDGEDE